MNERGKKRKKVSIVIQDEMGEIFPFATDDAMEKTLPLSNPSFLLIHLTNPETQQPRPPNREKNLAQPKRSELQGEKNCK